MCVSVCLFVCLSVCPIERTLWLAASSHVTLRFSFMYRSAREGGQRIAAMPASDFWVFLSSRHCSDKETRNNACDNSFYIFQLYQFAAVSRHFTLFTFISSLSSLKLNSHGMCVTHILTASNTFGQQRQSSFSLFGTPGGLFCPFPVFRH